MTGRKETSRFIQNVGSQFIIRFVSDKLILNKHVNKFSRGQCGRGVALTPTTNLHLAPRITVELFLYTPVGLHGLFWGELYFYSYKVHKSCVSTCFHLRLYLTNFD